MVVLDGWLDLMILKVSCSPEDCDSMMLCLVCPRVELAFWCVGYGCYVSDPAKVDGVMWESLHCACLSFEDASDVLQSLDPK